MNVREATAEDINYLIEKYPRLKPVICTWDGSYTLIAEDGNDILACASVFRREIPAPLNGKMEDFINVIEVFETQSRNKGIGSALVKNVIKIAKEKGSVQVRAFCDINNVQSHALWDKNNFGISPVKNADGSILGSFVTYRL